MRKVWHRGAGMSKIEWTDWTWNPVRGCSPVSAGCANCYAARQARRMDRPGGAYEGLTRDSGKWSGKLRISHSKLNDGLPPAKAGPKMIFVNSMSDVFHEDMPAPWQDDIFGMIRTHPQHIFQILTKRPEQARGYLSRQPCPPNAWLGVSVENQETAAARIPVLLDIAAPLHFVSAEPLLGPVNLAPWLQGSAPRERCLQWVISGGESGPGWRPSDPAWHSDLRDQCARAGVAYFFKQTAGLRKKDRSALLDGEICRAFPDPAEGAAL